MTKRMNDAVGKASLFTLLGVAMSCIPVQVMAQRFPEHPVRIVVPSAPGGSIDTTARALAIKLTELWKQSVYVENRAGAAMIIGTEAVARATADGYTLLVAHDGAMAINPAVYKTLSYSPERDFAPVSLLTTIPLMLLAGPSMPAKTLPDFLVAARAKPGTINHANSGHGTLLPSELFKAMAKVDYLEVPYKGGALAMRATLAGETDVTFADMATASAAIKGAQLRPIAIASKKRAREYPGLPTIDESGVPGYEARTWMGLFAPAGTPPQIVSQISADVQKILAMPDTRKRLESFSMDVQSGTAQDLSTVMSADTAKWKELARTHNLRVD